MADHDSTAEGDHVDIGAVLEAMARDEAPRRTEPDAAPVPGSPIDAALALLHMAANGDDAANDDEAAQLYEQRQQTYRDAISKELQ